jgi:F-type H+-transporting ATPase subunit b
MALAAHLPIAAGGSFLITPNVGLMVWVLVVFFISFFVLRKWVYPSIVAVLDSRAKTINDSIDSAEEMRQKADELLAEYRARLKEARGQADEIVSRARQTAETQEREAQAQAKANREQMLEQTRRDIEAETRRAIQEIRREVADLTVMATEKDPQGPHRGGPAAAHRRGHVRARLQHPGYGRGRTLLVVWTAAQTRTREGGR